MIRRFNRSANIFFYITIVLMSSSIVGAEEHKSITQVEWHQWRGANREWGISRNGDPQGVVRSGAKRVVAAPTWRGVFRNLSCERTRLYHVRQG